jgi:lipoprotein-anchoring transpeptidase ErfK/SrfK
MVQPAFEATRLGKMTMYSVSLKRLAAYAAGILISGAVWTSAANASVSVRIDISAQTMTVDVDGDRYATWRVSTARSGYYTPRGNFKPYVLKKMHYSRKYDNSPMPHSIFFRGGYAIHATNYVKSLGRPASHGCIRLAPGNAATLYGLVKQYGMKSTKITIVN